MCIDVNVNMDELIHVCMFMYFKAALWPHDTFRSMLKHVKFIHLYIELLYSKVSKYDPQENKWLECSKFHKQLN